MGVDLVELWGHMGWFAKGIAGVLILMSIISLSVAVAKWIRFRRMARATTAFAPQFTTALEEGDVAGALALTEALGITRSEAGRFVESPEHCQQPRVIGVGV